jgi:hypothetical protein
LVDPYLSNAVERVWINRNEKGCGWTKTSLMVNTVCF